MTDLRAAAQKALKALENGKRVRLYEGGTKYQPDLEDAAITALRAALAQPSGEPLDLQLWCDTCEGTGQVHQEHQLGVIGSGGTFNCPDCDGNGFVKTSRYVLAATAQPAPARVPLTDAE